ncbi:MAG: tRNA epoxyqueuosine(34) reductase QueG [Gemmataceae bacterium]|nr:tRNA epoxyqueuosine(34) reductase QueG [Gemmataceae bacterium]MDW8266104.1 tRNA epoxyqueuosine(34) reductase QueG [Gemmataceae bacterium]
MPALEDRLKQEARRLGFDLVGIAPATEADDFDHLCRWLDRGFAGDMAYMHRQAEARRHPASILPNVRSVVMLGMNYNPGPESQPARPGRVARYARGLDYHDVLRERLNQLLAWVRQERPGCSGRGVVDTAPLLERDFARRAGLGWIGKNTMLLNKRLGSWLFLAALLLDCELRPDPPFAQQHCGHCTACLDACPTEALVAPYQLDARRCISYLTIELRGPIPEPWRERLDGWLFGCDICQEVCPWNRKAPATAEPALAPRSDLEAVDLHELFALDEAEFRRRYRGTALWRARRRGLLRNAALILGAQGGPESLPVLERALHDPEPLIREAAAWALDRLRQRISLASATASGPADQPTPVPSVEG